MKKNRFTKEQVIELLREKEAGMEAAEVCRKLGVTKPAFSSGRRSSGAWMFLMPED